MNRVWNNIIEYFRNRRIEAENDPRVEPSNCIKLIHVTTRRLPI